MSSFDNNNRFRFQIQFDLYAQEDSEAVKKALKVLKKVRKKDVFNSNLIWGAESPFASLNQRELDLNDEIYKLKISKCE